MVSTRLMVFGLGAALLLAPLGRPQARAEAPHELRRLSERLAAEAFDVTRMVKQDIRVRKGGSADGSEINAVNALQRFYRYTRRLLTLSHELGTRLPAEETVLPFRPVGTTGTLQVVAPAMPTGTEVSVVEHAVGVIPERIYTDTFWKAWSAAEDVESSLGFAWGLDGVMERWSNRVRPLLSEMHDTIPRLRGAMTDAPALVR